MNKRFLSLILTLFMVITQLNGMTISASAASIWDGTSPAANAGYTFSGGDGSIATPYLISSAADLAQLAANVNAGTSYSDMYFMMTDNIVLNDVSNVANWDTTPPANVWVPIGASLKPFSGTFYGQGYSVSGVYINSSSDLQGLFGNVGMNGKLTNIGVANSYIKGGQFVGGIAGFCGGRITNCYNTGAVSGTGYVGGIGGYLQGATFANCYNTGTVSGTSNIGGIAGCLHLGSEVNYCYSTVNVIGGSTFTGGTVSNCGTIGASQIVTAGTADNCGAVQTLLTGLTSGSSTLLEALNAGVVIGNSQFLYTWKADNGNINGGYPIFDAAVVPVYAVSASTNSVTANGVTATATFGTTPYAVGATATVTITMSGTATAAGTHTIGLTSAGDVGSITAPGTVTKTVEANATPTDTFQFTFSMPATAVDDLVVTNTFLATPVAEAPTVSFVAAPSNGTYTAGQNLDFTVIYNAAVNVVTTGGTPYMTLTIGSTDVHARYYSGSGTMSLTFRYTVLSGQSDSDGVAVGALALNGSTIKNGAGTDATLTLNNVGSTADVKVDAIAPTVTTQAVSSITTTSATGNGNITGLGNPNPTAYGVCWSTNTNPTTADSKTDKGAVSATGAFTASMTGLTANTTYYVRAFATNTAGTVYGTEVSFNTLAVMSSGGDSGGSTTPSAPVSHINNGGSTTDSNLDQLVSGGKTLTVDGDKGAKLVFDTEALKSISGQTSDNIKVEMKDVSPTHQESLPGKQVFSLTVSSGGSTITNFGGAVTVTLPYTLKDGESADKVTVWYLASDGEMTEIPCTYDVATGLATFTVTHFSLYVVGVPWENSFTDVKENDWFYGAVEFVSQNSMMKGIGGPNFSPNTTVTRGMLVTILWRLDKEPATTKMISFTDVSNDNWYGKAVAWAAANNIVTGYAGKFKPDDDLTREQLAAILYRYAAYKNYNTNVADTLSAYADKPSDWALSSVSWAVAKGLINGNDGRLDPNGTATRAQTATILQRFIKNAAK